LKIKELAAFALEIARFVLATAAIGVRLHASMVLPEFHGIEQKLKRSHENILNLEREIAAFFQSSEYPSVLDENKKIIKEAAEYHQNRPVPLRFSVLAGEIIHHLRSILDHIVWHFSEPSYREAHPRWIEFPILESRPPKKDLFTSYERKIKGITKPVVRDLIDRLQPYSCIDPVDSLLLVIHNFDIADKHRELVFVVGTGAIRLPIEVMDRYIRYKWGVPDSPPVDFGAEYQRHGDIVPEIAFSEFGRSQSEPIVQGLSDLQNYVVEIVSSFDKLR
jgi:hypothetical protein